MVRGITDSNEAESHSELPSTYQPYGLIEVGLLDLSLLLLANEN